MTAAASEAVTLTISRETAEWLRTKGAGGIITEINAIKGDSDKFGEAYAHLLDIVSAVVWPASTPAASGEVKT